MPWKTTARYLAHRTVLRPHFVRHCSQTVYETLLGCLRMWEATGQAVWKDRARRVLALLITIQQTDGGFDIGYAFNFGRLHKKGDSTSPELVGLVAMAEYGRLFGVEAVAAPARRAAEWIRGRALDLAEGRWAIPYSPYTVRDVMVYNGVSFAAGALGRYLGIVEEDRELCRIYRGMVAYLDGVLQSNADLPGRFWYYSDQSRADLVEPSRSKIDYYHQAQQVEMHALAEQACPAAGQLRLVQDAADHLVGLSERRLVIPYANATSYFGGQIHLWGLASVVPGMLEAAVILPTLRSTYHRVARRTLEWIIQYGWNGKHFEAILHPDGSGAATCGYMVRSEAWVFNALAAAAKHLGNGPWNDLAEQCYANIDAVDFSGPEIHASTTIARTMISLYRGCFRRAA